MQKTLILIRHAHRDNSRRELDNGLSDKGREQSRALKKFFSERFSKEDTGKGLWLLSSPKVRCQETLLPIAKCVDRSVDVHPDLDEQGPSESSKAFTERVQAFLREWMEAKVELTVLCSHGDWLPVATKHLIGLEQAYKKGSWMELEAGAGPTQLRWYIPSFKALFK